jgi:hypothetical protein
MCGPKRNEVTGGLRKLYNDKLHDLYSSPNSPDQIKEDEMVGAGSEHGGKEKSVQNFGLKA